MNREILFRGQTRKKGEKVRLDGSPLDSKWVYGGIFQGQGDYSIIYSHGDGKKYSVYSDTVGQYTGLTDRNGVKIFEGDIAKIHYFFENYDPDTLGAFDDEANVIGKLSITSVGVYFESANAEGCLCDYLEEPEEELEVIGNIFDNPELLEGKA